jgi:hypothetical protein
MINVVIFHVIINTHIAQPCRNILVKLILPRYSGARKRDEAPK